MDAKKLERILISDYSYTPLKSRSYTGDQDIFLDMLVNAEGIKESLKFLKGIYRLRREEQLRGYVSLTGEDVKVFKEGASVKPRAFKVILKTLQEELGLPDKFSGEELMMQILELAAYSSSKGYTKGQHIVSAIKAYKKALIEQCKYLEMNQAKLDMIEILTYIPKEMR